MTDHVIDHVTDHVIDHVTLDVIGKGTKLISESMAFRESKHTTQLMISIIHPVLEHCSLDIIYIYAGL